MQAFTKTEDELRNQLDVYVDKFKQVRRRPCSLSRLSRFLSILLFLFALFPKLSFSPFPTSLIYSLSPWRNHSILISWMALLGRGHIK